MLETQDPHQQFPMSRPVTSDGQLRTSYCPNPMCANSLNMMEGEFHDMRHSQTMSHSKSGTIYNRHLMGCGHLKCPSLSRNYRNMVRPSSSGNLLIRTTPDFFKDTRIRTCSSIKLVDGVPKAVSFPLADKRARSVKMKTDSMKKLMAEPDHTIYQ
jgi:hypothetical protein